MSDIHTSHDGASHGSHKSYIIGLVLSIVLTLLAFGVVMLGDFSTTTMIVTIIVMAVLQIMVQLILFMHLELKTQQGRESGGFFFFTLVILSLIVGGSLWIMHHLRLNLM
ncbi:cytochrome o ubiquinol oxidase subunit IV [Salinicola sp. LHM]|jgi:cytochrome o ubiquinol oxidase operon protein cyoD|uniref:cytochrome o ubiquinol oxidase subunit IV n=1 Tax=Salinicola sp. LHM TaxID=3065298 RepID=UPI002ACE151B|nr:cytochrome o ubiquinol oxidase subunit IV [Salinicola sp. LHM]MED5499855.1 cytochrome o ubiquinol oxidase subunit IV [Pseudomonadota bacterium]WQH31415.1 cytochrome o ubiquinol oxidase subunit IV [Salinicola sp. LHM]